MRQEKQSNCFSPKLLKMHNKKGFPAGNPFLFALLKDYTA